MMKRWFCWPWHLPKIEPDYLLMEVEHRLEALELQLTIMERDEKAHDLRLLHDELRRMQYPDQEHLGRT